MTLSCHLDKRSADLKREALGRISIALAGTPPNCFHSFMKDNFGYDVQDTPLQSEAPTEEDTEVHPATSGTERDLLAPPRQKTRKSAKGLSEGEGNYPPPSSTNAVAFKPGRDAKKWTKTGLAMEYLPTKSDGQEEYGCPFPACDFAPRQKLDLVCTHIRRHLNICVSCHHCEKTFWSIEGWKKHSSSIHPDIPKVPMDASEPETFQPLGTNPNIIDVKQEEEAIRPAVSLPNTGFNVESELILVDEGDTEHGDSAPMES